MTEDLDRRIAAVAARLGKSYSACVTDLLEARLDDPLPYEGIATDGPTDLSTNVDRYLDKQFAKRRR